MRDGRPSAVPRLRPPTVVAARRAWPAPEGWSLVLVLSLLTCGWFFLGWFFVQASWVKKVDPSSRVFPPLIAYSLLYVVVFAVDLAQLDLGPLRLVLAFGGLVPYVMAVFRLKDGIEDSPIARERHLVLSGLASFFLSVFYFQYHLRALSDHAREQVG